jgi:peptide/nickel transport system permease protein
MADFGDVNSIECRSQKSDDPAMRYLPAEIFQRERKRRVTVFILRRLLTLVATLAGASVIIFLVLDALPGNAAEMLMGADSSPDALRAMTVKLGLDQPLAVRYLRWIGGLLVGDMGNSFSYGTPVAELIAERLALTVPLAIMAMLLTVVLALAAGVYTAANHNRIGDVGVMAVTQFGIAIPNFWFAILLILLFSVKLQWLTAGGFAGWGEGILAGLRSLLLPAISLAVVQAAILARVTRSAVLEVLREDFVRTARAKGLSRRQVLWGHVLRNAMIPVMTVMGLQFANLLAGTIVVENVFYLPGLGRLIFQSIANRDLIVVRNCVMLLAAMVVVVNFVVDVLYAVIDPRIKVSEL